MQRPLAFSWLPDTETPSQCGEHPATASVFVEEMVVPLNEGAMSARNFPSQHPGHCCGEQKLGRRSQLPRSQESDKLCQKSQRPDATDNQDNPGSGGGRSSARVLQGPALVMDGPAFVGFSRLLLDSLSLPTPHNSLVSPVSRTGADFYCLP